MKECREAENSRITEVLCSADCISLLTFLFYFLGLSCLLIVLFIDDPKIHTTRLHRILRNLCYHAPTRDWVVKSLLSILEKSNDKQSQTEISDVQPPAKIRKSTSKSNTFSSDLAMAKGKICNILKNVLNSFVKRIK